MSASSQCVVDADDPLFCVAPRHGGTDRNISVDAMQNSPTQEASMRGFTLACTIALALWPLIARAVSADDAELPGQTSQAVRSLSQFRWHLATIEEFRPWMQRAVSFHEQGKTEQARRAAYWANLGLSRKIDVKESGPLDAKAVELLRTRSKKLDEYHLMMTRALDLHNQGDVHEAHRISSEVASRFPDQQPATWFAEQTKDGQQIPAGGWIEFFNRSDHVVLSVDLHYAGSSSVFGFSHTHHIVRDLNPGETQRVYTEDLPKGPSRLYADLQMDVDGHPFGVMTSASIFSRNRFGFVPTVIIEKDGAVSFSTSQSARRAERAKTRPPPTVEEQIEWMQKQDSSRASDE